MTKNLFEDRLGEGLIGLSYRRGRDLSSLSLVEQLIDQANLEPIEPKPHILTGSANWAASRSPKLRETVGIKEDR